MGDFGDAKDKWVCPNDRELCLRAKLKTGWSVKTNATNIFGGRTTALNDTEQETILSVIRRAECLDRVEQERVGRLMERLENMKKNAMGNGTTQCVLCADEFGILGASPLLCNDCKKAVCTKCGVDTLSAHKEQLWLCKICAEYRETWKKSNAWFYKGLPKYVLPGRKTDQGRYSRSSEAARSYTSWLQSKAGKGGSDREYTDSSEDEFKSSRLSKRAAASKKSSVEAGENKDGLAAIVPPADGPSPAHPPSPSRAAKDGDSPRVRSPGHDGINSRDRRGEAPSPGHWYKPRQPDRPDTQDPRRTHYRKETQSSRHRPQTTNRNEEVPDERTSAPAPPEVTSKKANQLTYKKKRTR